jgi:hypothetical protein
MSITTTEFSAPGVLSRIADGVAAIASGFGLLVSACAASAEYERLSHLSDASLATRGLSRSDLPRVVLARLYA